MREALCVWGSFSHVTVKHRLNVTFDSSTGAFRWLRQIMRIVSSEMLTSPRVFKAKYWNIFHPRDSQSLCWGTATHPHLRVGGGLLLTVCHPALTKIFPPQQLICNTSFIYLFIFLLKSDTTLSGIWVLPLPALLTCSIQQDGSFYWQESRKWDTWSGISS